MATVPSYLQNQQAEFCELADTYLLFGEHRFLVHSQVLSHCSQVLSSLFHIALSERAEQQATGTVSTAGGRELPTVVIPAKALPQSVKEVSRQHVELFLLCFYEPHTSPTQVADADVLLRLADYFGATELVSRCEGWLCTAVLAFSGDEGLACAAFAVALSHRLTRATALLLPWALQRLSHGTQPQQEVWADAQRVRRALLEALRPHVELKALCMEAAWWSGEAGGRCGTCGCLADDISRAFDFSPATRRHWGRCLEPALAHIPAETAPQVLHAAQRLQQQQGQRLRLGQPSQQQQHPACGTCPYQRSVMHFAHLLQEAAWGCTPAAAPSLCSPSPAG